MSRLIKASPLLLFLSVLSCNPSRKTVTYSGEAMVKGELLSTETPVKQLSTEQRKDTPVFKSVYDSIQLKYAGYLNIQPDMISDTRLYHFIEHWLHTPYKWGGVDENGIDCSAFLQKLFAEVYLIEIPRTSLQQFFTEKVERFKSSKYLSEGDLVFFRTMDNKFISHVGLYLHNDMFVNSSSSKGVSIASLKDPYWRKRYVAAGRLKTNTP